MRYDTVVCARRQARRGGSVLLVVLGVLTVLSLVGLSLVVFARTESKTARNFRLMTEATLLVEGEVERVKAVLLNDLYPAAGPTTGTAWRLWGESYDYPNAGDGWLFGMLGDGSGVLQTSFGGTAMPTVDNDPRDTPTPVLDSVWRSFSLSSGLQARVATLVMDHDGLANLNVWGNTQDPAAGTHSSHQGLGRHELNLMRVLWPGTMTSDEGDTYRALFLGRVAPHSAGGRYGLARPGVSVGPGALGVDDDRDSGRAPHIALVAADDDADGTTDEADEGRDEPDEYCWSNPGGTGDDRDLPFDQADLWELLRDGPFRSRFEYLMDTFNLDAAFAPGTNLGSYRRNLTTLSADAEWVGAGAMDVADRLQVRLDLNHATRDEFETAFRQAGFDVPEVRQLTVNLLDARDTDDDVTCHPDDATVFGHERQPFINEVFFATWRPPGWGPPEGHGPKDGSGWSARIAVAIELYNPYDTPLNLSQWELRIDIEGDTPASQVLVIDDPTDDEIIPANGYLTLISSDTDAISGGLNLVVEGKVIVLGDSDFLLWPVDDHVYRLRLVRARQIGQRPSPANGELVVDDTAGAIDFNILAMPATSAPGHPGKGGGKGPPPGAEWQGLDLFRRDAEANHFETSTTQHPDPTLGKWNIPAEDAIKPARYAVPIPNRGAGSFASVADLGQVLTHTQNGNVPYTDDYAAMAPDEAERAIKFDLSGDWYAGGTTPDATYQRNRRVLDLFCVNRPDHDGLDNDGDGTVDEPDEATWPVAGRLNVNTASQAMLERALWRGPYPTAPARDKATLLAHELVKRRETIGPFTHLGDLFSGRDLALALAAWADDGQDNDGDGVGAGAGSAGEKDERDATFRLLANLLTTRSNVFTVFVTAEIRDPDRGELLAARKAIAVVDRSRAAMTLRWAGTTRVPYVTSPVSVLAFRWISD